MIYDHIKQPYFPGVLKIDWLHYSHFANCFMVMKMIKSEQATLWSHYGACFNLPLLTGISLFVWQQEPVHSLTIATIHLNQLKKGATWLCSLPKCQESSSGLTWREMVRQSSTFITDSFKDPIHFSCSHWRFPTGFNRLRAHLCLTN